MATDGASRHASKKRLLLDPFVLGNDCCTDAPSSQPHQRLAECSHASCSETHSAKAAEPKSHKMLRRPLRLDLASLGQQPLQPLEHEACGTAAAPPSVRSSGTSMSEWMDRMEAQLTSRSRHGACTTTCDGSNEDVLVPPAFVCLGLLGGSHFH